MKYIDAEKLIAEIKIIQQSLESRDVRLNQVKKIRTECLIEFSKCIIDVITSLQQELPDVDLEKALKGLDNAYFDLDGIAVKGATYYLTVNDLKEIARNFYELGLKARKEEMHGM